MKRKNETEKKTREDNNIVKNNGKLNMYSLT